jgi:glycosyltransferase involved in cell wall biosynthesis
VKPETSEISFNLFAAGASGPPIDLPPGATFTASPISERNYARIWRRLNLPIPVEWWTGRIDVFHGTDFFAPPTRRGVRRIITIHDLAFERYPDETMPGMLTTLKRDVPRSVQQADAIISVSEATRRDVIDIYDAPPDHVITIPHGVSERFFRRGALSTDIRQKLNIPNDPIILTVGTLQPRKNHLRLVQAFAHVRGNAVLVIAGAKGWGYQAVIDEVARLRIRNPVRFVGQVSDADLPDLYRSADLFVYPALYEGFGLPPLEAMASGVPVIASNTSSLPEVVGDAGLLVDPLDVDQIAGAIQHVLDDPSLRDTLAEKGVARAREFTWERTARLTMAVYENQ